MSALPAPYSQLRSSAAVWGIDPSKYVPHRFHRQDQERVWLETNCYVDLWIELLSAAGVEPAAALSFTLAADFEGDQWTFFKFPLVDLQHLFGIDTQELSIWQAAHLHALEQVQRGRVVLMEVDSFYLPDTAGTAYKHAHVKTTVGIEHMDLERGRMGYFHNAGYYVVEGEDFQRLFRFEDPWTPGSDRLLPYTEFAKFDGLAALGDAARDDRRLAEASLALAKEHWRRRPRANPFVSYKPRLVADLEWLRGAPGEAFHQYAFVSVRQFGANFELASDYCKWLGAQGIGGAEAAAVAFGEIAQGAKSLQFKIARAVTLKRAFDPGAALDVLGGQWETAHGALQGLLG